MPGITCFIDKNTGDTLLNITFKIIPTKEVTNEDTETIQHN